jgi:hypothetical protein
MKRARDGLQVRRLLLPAVPEIHSLKNEESSGLLPKERSDSFHIDYKTNHNQKRISKKRNDEDGFKIQRNCTKCTKCKYDTVRHERADREMLRVRRS